MRSSRLAFVIVVASLAPASLASAQLRVLMGVESGAVVCADATSCGGAADCGGGETCVTVGAASGCVPEGGTLCCANVDACPEVPTAEGAASCSLAAGATEGTCVVTRPQENTDCAELFELPDMAGPCFGATGLADGDCDEDGVPNATDNCRCTANDDQRDCDQDGIGAQCEAAPNPSLRLPREACDGAQTYEELSCIRTMCGCYDIAVREDPWCADMACRALASVARTVDVCGAVMRDAGPRDSGTPRPDMGTPRADSGPRPDAGGTADSGALDAGSGGGDDDDDDGCSATPGAPRRELGWALFALAAIGLAASRRRRAR